MQDVAFGAEPYGLLKEFSKLIRVEGYSRQREQHMQSQEAEDACAEGEGTRS